MSNLIQVRPTLNYQFDKASTPEDMLSLIKSYGGTFTRANDTATFVNKFGQIETVNANLPRPDHDPVTLVNKALLIEEQRTNLVENSENFTGSDYARENGVTVTNNYSTAPNGEPTASRVYFDNITLSRIYDTIPQAQANTTLTFSVYLKSNTGSNINGVRMYLREAGFGTAYGGGSAVVVTPNWQRFTLTADCTGTTSGVMAMIYNITNGTDAWDLQVWGYQVEQGSFPTSYIPTSGSTATRSADLHKNADTNFPDRYNDVEGTFFAHFTPNQASQEYTVFSAHDGTANEVIKLYSETGTDLFFEIIDGGSTVAKVDLGTVAAGTTYKVCASYINNSITATINGVAKTTDTSATIPTVDTFNVGSSHADTLFLNGTIAECAYIPKIVTPAQQVKLTRTT